MGVYVRLGNMATNQILKGLNFRRGRKNVQKC